MGLQTPWVSLGMTEGIDRTTAESQMETFGRHIKCIQRSIKNDFEDKIIVGQDLGTKEDKMMLKSLIYSVLRR